MCRAKVGRHETNPKARGEHINRICGINWQFVLHFAPTHLRYTRLLWWLLVLAFAGCSTPVQVEWTTETEMNTAGFNLYRSESPNGPFDFKVNAHLIPASPDPLTGSSYQFTDPTARPGVTYYYLLQEVETTGAVNTHGPIAVQTAWLDWRWAAVAGGLAFAVVFLWSRAKRRDAG